MSEATTEELFTEISDFIEKNHTLLRSGAFIELAGFDNYVRELCESLVMLSQEERVQHAQRLQQLLYSLSELEETMMQYRDALSHEIRGLNEHQKANVAYRTVESIDKFKREDE